MNEEKKSMIKTGKKIRNKKSINTHKNKNLNIKQKKENNLETKINYWNIMVIFLLKSFIIFGLILSFNLKENKNVKKNKTNNLINKVKTITAKNKNIITYKKFNLPNAKFIINRFQGFLSKLKSKSHCLEYDPFSSFEKRLNESSVDLCKSSNSNHICYKNNINNYRAKNGVVCKMENVVIDPSKWKEDGYTYLGPVNSITKGCPILEKGFFNMKCESTNSISKCNVMYRTYFYSWNYNYNNSDNQEEELAPGKTVFFISRNQDSPNLFFGGAGIINALALIYLFKLQPENIQVVFLESMILNNDPYYIFYKEVISRGGTPIHIKELKKKYHISSAIHVPINWDSPCFILFSKLPHCKNPTKTFIYLNKYVDKYLNISNFTEPLKYDNETFYYSKTVTDPNSSKYTKFVTVQWRKAWPKGRKGQNRLLGNGPEILEKLTEILPKNILVRLVDTASLTLTEQISIMKKTDYFLGVHGAGLFLSVFLPAKSIVHEISLKSKTKNLLFMSILSGHKTFCDIWDIEQKEINGSNYAFFDPFSVAQAVVEHMSESNFFR